MLLSFKYLHKYVSIYMIYDECSALVPFCLFIRLFIFQNSLYSHDKEGQEESKIQEEIETVEVERVRAERRVC